MNKLIFFLLNLITVTIISQEVNLKQLESNLENTNVKDKPALLAQLAKEYLDIVPNKAIEFAEEGINLSKKNNPGNSILFQLHDLLGEAYYISSNIKKAIKNYEKALEYATDINDKLNISFNIGSIHLKNEKYRQAETYFLECLAYCKSSRNENSLLQVYNALYETYSFLESDDKSIYYLKAYYLLRDKILNIESNNEITLLKKMVKQTSFQLQQTNVELKTTQSHVVKLAEDTMNKSTAIKTLNVENKKKDETIIEKDTTIKVKEETVKKQNMVITLLIVIVFLILVFSVITFLMYQRINRYNKLLSQKNAIIIEQKEEIEAQSEEVVKQRDKIAFQKKEITDSIQYAKRIQTAVLPIKEQFFSVFNESFIMYKPRDIVSGDFYWFSKIILDGREKFIVCVADCTGHGVPGAFMSMLGISALNEIIRKETITTPSQLLNSLREMIKLILNQQGIDNETKDGMDASIIFYDKDDQSILYAGANNPIFIIEKDALTEYKAVKNPVGIHPFERPFEDVFIKVSTNSMLYMFTDGYADQLNANNLGKFKKAKFKTLLETIAKLPLSKQKDTLIAAHEDWKSCYDQTDDILVLGVRF